MATQTAAGTAQAIGEYIDIGKLSPSPTNPRKRFYADSLDELAGSIADKGVIEPLIVRRGGEAYQKAKKNRDNALAIYQALENEINSREYSKAHEAFARAEGNDDGFEIVCGERRYRASQLAKLETVPCIVRELTDDEVLDIQIHENLHREDVHPMDEAYGYQFLLDKLQCTVAEVAARVGKSEKFVLSRLKLNSLIPEAQEDLENGHLLLTYALEIAKFSPDIQKLILDEAAYEQERHWESRKGNWYTPKKTERSPWPQFLQFINEKVLRLLSAAPFDLKATNLRKDGLACVSCPERTGANVGLFEDDQVDKKDSCLNPGCFTAKKQQHITNIRERVAHEASVKPKSIPLLVLDRGYSSDGDTSDVYPRTKLTIIGKKPCKDYYGEVSKVKCDKSITGVTISDGQLGLTYTVCLDDSGCKTHYGRKSSSSSSGSPAQSEKETEAEQKKRRERKEELIDIKVCEVVRLKVLRFASEKFSAKFSMQNMPDDFLNMLIAKMWTENGGTDGTTKEKVVKNLLSQILSVKADSFSFGWEQANVAKKIEELSDTARNHLLFLLVYGNSGSMYYESYSSQKRIRDLAEEYEIDYRLFDAEARLAFAEEKHKKHVALYKVYLDAVRAGDANAKIPRPYEPTYKPKD